MSQESWESVADWYDKLQQKEGDWTHKLIFPFLLKAIVPQKDAPISILELGCGQGVFARMLPAKKISYVGVDIAPTLVQKARGYKYKFPATFSVQDVTKPFDLHKQFDRILFLLSFQNMKETEIALAQAKKHLAPGGRLVLLINHPCFRIPRQTSWGIDTPKKIQNRRVDRYMTPMEIPIDMHPGDKDKTALLSSFHMPLSALTKQLFEAGFTIQWIDEICSDKESAGAHAKMENRARDEFPLFLMLVAIHI